MRAGKLDRTIIVERASVTVAGDGTPTTTWAPVATLRAQLMKKSADEAMQAFGAETTTTATFRTRWLDGVTVADRIVYAGRIHDLKEVAEIGRREGLELRCLVKG